MMVIVFVFRGKHNDDKLRTMNVKTYVYRMYETDADDEEKMSGLYVCVLNVISSLEYKQYEMRSNL